MSFLNRFYRYFRSNYKNYRYLESNLNGFKELNLISDTKSVYKQLLESYKYKQHYIMYKLLSSNLKKVID